jgi:hypothetical protein
MLKNIKTCNYAIFDRLSKWKLVPVNYNKSDISGHNIIKISGLNINQCKTTIGDILSARLTLIKMRN